MTFRFHHLSLFCILSVAMVLLAAASENFQDPSGHKCIEKCKDGGDGLCYKTCYEMSFISGGDCFYDTPDHSVKANKNEAIFDYVSKRLNPCIEEMSSEPASP